MLNNTKMMEKFLKNIAIPGLVTLSPLMNYAQWSPDPAENTMVRDTIGLIVVPHVATAGGGDTYISWYSATEELRFDVCMQHFDSQGNKLWGENGLVLSAHETDTWVTDYSLAVDHEGCAVLATQDRRDAGFSNGFAYRIAPDGQMKWGEDGIRLTDDSDFNPWPSVLITPEDQFIFLNTHESLDTTQQSRLGLQKVDKQGMLLWGENFIENENLDYYFPRMLLTEQGNIMVSWLAVSNDPDTVLGQVNYLHVYLQKFDSEGQSLWPEPVRVDTGNIMVYGSLYTLPWLANNGNDGAYIMWQSFWQEEPTVMVNQVSSGGQVLWDQGGIQAELTAENTSSSPSMCYSPEDDHLYVFFSYYRYDAINFSDCWAVGGQKFANDGTRLWGDSAKIVVPFLCSTDSSNIFITARQSGDGEICIFHWKEYLLVNGPDTSLQTELYASLVDQSGNLSWDPGHVFLSNAWGYKMHFDAGELNNNQWITSWEDYRSELILPGASGIYAQNITVDGNLGPVSVDGPLMAHTDGMTCYPVPFKDLFNISFELLERSEVIFRISDLRGRYLKSMEAGTQDRGKHTITVQAGALSPGIYLVQMRAGTREQFVRVIKTE
jgi:hypothetical protein